MEYKNNYKYFYPNWVVAIIGGCIGGFGLFMTLLTRMRSSYFIGLLIVGAGITIFSVAGKLRDSDIDDQVDDVRKTMNDESFKEFGFTDRQLKTITYTKDFGEYSFPENQTLHIKRGSDGKFRSSEYTCWSASIGQDSLYFYIRRVSLTEEIDEKQTKTIKLDNYAGAVITEHTYTHKYGKDNTKTYIIKYSTFDLTDSGGKVYSIPVNHDAEIDDFIERIEHTIKQRHKN